MKGDALYWFDRNMNDNFLVLKSMDWIFMWFSITLRIIHTYQSLSYCMNIIIKRASTIWFGCWIIHDTNNPKDNCELYGRSGAVHTHTHTQRHKKAQMGWIFHRVYCTNSQLHNIDPLWTAQNVSGFSMVMNEDVVRRKLFRITGHFWGESCGQRWIPLKRPVMWNFFVVAWTSCWTISQ